MGDCVQGWRYENSSSLSDKDRNAGHSFFIVDVEKDADGNVVKYTILTANTGTPGGVSRVQRNWSAYEDPRIGRFYKIEGE